MLGKQETVNWAGLGEIHLLDGCEGPSVLVKGKGFERHLAGLAKVNLDSEIVEWREGFEDKSSQEVGVAGGGHTEGPCKGETEIHFEPLVQQWVGPAVVRFRFAVGQRFLQTGRK